jgi:hypothetical protein
MCQTSEKIILSSRPEEVCYLWNSFLARDIFKHSETKCSGPAVPGRGPGTRGHDVDGELSAALVVVTILPQVASDSE